MAKFGEASSVAVAFVGKLKTAAQMTAIPLLLYNAQLFGFEVRPLGTILVWIAAALTLWSMGYIHAQGSAEIPGRIDLQKEVDEQGCVSIMRVSLRE